MTDATRNSLTTEYTYNDASWVTKIDYPNSTNTNYTYNSRGWMTAIDLKDSSNNTIFSLPYQYDANGNVTEETIGNDTISYTYDALNRLTFIDQVSDTDKYLPYIELFIILNRSYVDNKMFVCI